MIIIAAPIQKEFEKILWWKSRAYTTAPLWLFVCAFVTDYRGVCVFVWCCGVLCTRFKPNKNIFDRKICFWIRKQQQQQQTGTRRIQTKIFNWAICNGCATRAFIIHPKSSLYYKTKQTLAQQILPTGHTQRHRDASITQPFVQNFIVSNVVCGVYCGKFLKIAVWCGILRNWNFIWIQRLVFVDGF